jgi:hypothetical protein
MLCPTIGDREGQYPLRNIIPGSRPSGGFVHARLVPDEQRPTIRDRCLTLLDEEDDVVSDVDRTSLVRW